MDKPKLDVFLKEFQQKVNEVNHTYINSKQQFEQEMKKFKEYQNIIEDQNEQEAILI